MGLRALKKHLPRELIEKIYTRTKYSLPLNGEATFIKFYHKTVIDLTHNYGYDLLSAVTSQN